MLSADRWTAVAESEFEWEREALRWLRDRLPDEDVWRVWSNFEFIADDGSINEVDCLVLSPTGLFLVEIKSRPGRLEGDARTWVWTTDGRRYHYDNPRYLADKKAKRLASLLKKQPSITRGKTRLPRIEALIFLSAERLKNDLPGPARAGVHLRDGPTITAAGEPGIAAALAGEGANGAPAVRKVDQKLARLLAHAVEEAGIRPSHRHRRVADYELKRLIFEGERFQDWEANHVQIDTIRRRVRLYPYELAADDAARAVLKRAALREFQILEGIEHPGILRVRDLIETERGPALLFDHEQDAQRLDFWLQEHGGRLTDELRLHILRQIAEAVLYAHRRRLYHRALNPDSILVHRPAAAQPRLRLFNWALAARRSATNDAKGGGTTGTLHVADQVDRPATVYLAPEIWHNPDLAGPHMDVFSWGALAYRLFAGRPPADTVFDLSEKLKGGSGLRLSDALDGAPREIQHLIHDCTHPSVSQRIPSMDQVLAELERAEAALLAPPADSFAPPHQAKAGDVLESGFHVLQRLGAGSSAIALLVAAEGSEEELVLKVAIDPDHDDRLRAEGEVLKTLRHDTIVECKDIVTLGGRTGLLMTRAGSETLAQRLRDKGRLSLDLLERFGEDLLRAVQHLEEKGVAHRDIKPDNIGVERRTHTGKLHLVLFDFSLARTPADNILAGTRPYLDPFLVHRRPRRWDLYAERFGAAMTLYETATGTLPVWGDGKSDPALLDCEVSLDVGLFDPVLREAMTGFFTRALAREPKDRFDNAEDMLKAWRLIFQASQTVRPAADPRDGIAALAPKLEATTAVGELGYSVAALNVLEGLGIHTVNQLLAEDRIRFRYLTGVGDKVRKEIRLTAKALAQLRPDLCPINGTASGEDETADGRTDLDTLADRLLPRRPLAAETPEDQALAHLIGYAAPEGTAASAWLGVAAVADRSGLPLATLGTALAKGRERWHEMPGIRMLRDSITDLVQQQGGVMGAAELAQAIMLKHGSVSEGPDRHRIAHALARAAVEAEGRTASPRFTRFGGTDRPLVALDQTHADYGIALGDRADALAAEDPLPTPQKCLDELLAIPRPDEVAEVSPQRLLRLAVAAAGTAALSSRGEVYPRGLSAARALALAVGSLVGPSWLTPEQIAQRVQGRYALAEPLPDRPALDELLAAAGADLLWYPAGGAEHTGAYVPRSRFGDSSGTDGRTRRHSTGGAGAVPETPESLEADKFEEKLRHAERIGAFLALATDSRRVARAEEELTRRFAVRPLSLDRLLIDAMKEEAAALGVAWDVVLAADAAERDSLDWRRLIQLVHRAWDRVPPRLGQGKETTLLLHPGLLARYDLMNRIDGLRDGIGSADGPRGLWLLVTQDAGGRPMVDGVPVPVLTNAHWARIPPAWIANIHRSA